MRTQRIAINIFRGRYELSFKIISIFQYIMTTTNAQNLLTKVQK